MKKAFVLLVMVFAALALNAQEMKTLTWGGQERQYLEYVPSTYSEETPAPVLFMLHGLGDQATNFFNATNISAIAERKGWIVVCPQAMPFDIEIPYVGTYPFGSSWGAGITVTVNFQLYGIPLNFDVTVNPDADDSGFLMAALQTLGEEYNLEQDSVFFAGFSLGACMAHRMAIEHGERINAIAALSGVVGNDMVEVTPTANVNVLEVFGTNDEIISYDSAIISLQGYGTPSIGLPAEQTLEFWRAFNQCDTEPIFEEYPNTHNDGLTFEMYGYPNGANDSHVAFLKVNNGVHRWYTGSSYDIDYTEEIIRFFTGTIDVTDVPEQCGKALAVYPNPATSFIQVDSQDEVSVYDLCGKLVLKDKGSSRIDVSSLHNGVYFIKVGNESKKLIINR